MQVDVFGIPAVPPTSLRSRSDDFWRTADPARPNF